MIKKLGKLAALAGAGAAARRYLRDNPDKVNKFAEQAGRFVDQRTKGRYHSQIGGAVRKVKGANGRS
ncbi:MAG: antitoxin [Pseudonocardiaceae bacterium]